MSRNGETAHPAQRVGGPSTRQNDDHGQAIEHDGTSRTPIGRYLAGLGAGWTWTPWAEFLDQVRQRRGLAAHNDLHTWRLVRPAVLAELDAAGLVAIVERTSGPVLIEHHHADTAGLVRVSVDGDVSTMLDDPDKLPGRRGAYLTDVAERFGLRLAPGVPRSLRAFCGQQATTHALREIDVSRSILRRVGPRYCWTEQLGRDDAWCSGCPGSSSCGRGLRWPDAGRVVIDQQAARTIGPYRPAWLDHVAAWVDEAGRPVLSVDVLDVQRVATAVVADVEGEGLPLRLDGPHADVWAPGSALLLWRWDSSAPVLPARFAPDVEAARLARIDPALALAGAR